MKPQENESIGKDNTHCQHCGIGPFQLTLEKHEATCDYNTEHVMATLEAEAKALNRSELESKAKAQVRSDPLEEARLQYALCRSVMGENDICNNNDATVAFESNLPIYGQQRSELTSNEVKPEQEHPQANNNEAVQKQPQEVDKEAVRERPQEEDKKAVRERPQDKDKKAVRERPQDEDNELQSEEKDDSFEEDSDSSIGSYSSDDFLVNHRNCDGASSYEADSTEDEDEDEDTSEHEDEYSEDESLLSIEETEVANMQATMSQRPRRSCTAKKKNISEEYWDSDGTDMMDDYDSDEYDTSESEINSEDSVLSEIESDLSDNECDEDKGTGAGSENSATGDVGEDKRAQGTAQNTRSGGQLSEMRQTTIHECRPFAVGKYNEK